MAGGGNGGPAGRGDRSAPLSVCFPLAELYSDLLAGPQHVVRERKTADAFLYSERHLQCLWFDPRWRPAELRSSRGESVSVRDPGRWNLEAGPDFLDATLAIGPGQRVRRGDVEIHVRPADWTRHGHGTDPRYARVAAHVCYAPGALPDGSLPPGALQVSLAAPLARDPLFSFESIDVAAYPYAAVTAAAPCAAILAGWTPEKRGCLLDAAGQERLRRKAARLAAAIARQGEDQVLYEETLCALGYKHNRVPFRRLARALPLDTLREESGHDVTSAYALLVGVSGLMPRRGARADNPAQRFIRALWDRWWRMQSRWDADAMDPGDWRLAGLRPQNHPLRRLAAAAALFAPPRQLARDIGAVPTDNADAWRKTVVEQLRAANVFPYWERRLSLRGAPTPGTTALVGAGRAAAVLANVVVPFLAATGRDVTLLLQRLPPEQDNALVRQTAYALFGPDHNPALYRGGLRRQGLLQIFFDFCVNARADGAPCPLVKALREFACPAPPP